MSQEIKHWHPQFVAKTLSVLHTLPVLPPCAHHHFGTSILLPPPSQTQKRSDLSCAGYNRKTGERSCWVFSFFFFLCYSHFPPKINKEIITLRGVFIFNKIPGFPYRGAGSYFSEIIKKMPQGILIYLQWLLRNFLIKIRKYWRKNQTDCVWGLSLHPNRCEKINKSNQGHST